MRDSKMTANRNSIETYGLSLYESNSGIGRNHQVVKSNPSEQILESGTISFHAKSAMGPLNRKDFKVIDHKSLKLIAISRDQRQISRPSERNTHPNSPARHGIRRYSTAAT